MFEDFTYSARWILVVAHAEARMASHPQVGAAHIALACWLAADTPVSNSLRELGLSGRIARAWLGFEIRATAEAPDDPPFAAGLLTRSRELADAHGMRRVHPADLLQAATEDPDGAGSRMIRAQGMSHTRIESVLEGLTRSPSRDDPAWRRRDADARNVVRSSLEVARLHGHDHVGTEHLFLAILERDEESRRALIEQAIEPHQAYDALRATAGGGSSIDPSRMHFSRTCRAALDAAGRETLAMGRVWTTPAHLLCGILRHGEGTAMELLDRIGADSDELRRSLWPENQPPSAAASSS